MKKLLLTLIAVGLASTSFADIQAPPNSQQTAIHKLGRGVSNLLYGVTELPARVIGINASQGNSSGAGAGIIEGTHRSIVRVGYGIFEILTFPAKTYKQSYKAPYQNIEYDPYNGYSEFSPEIGWQSKFGYSRKQNF